MYSLSDVVGSASDPTNFDKNVIIRQKIAGKIPHRFGKCCAEHERLTGNYGQ